MSERKKTTTLYLFRDIVQRCKELGINMSDVVNRTLSILVETPGIHDEEIQLAILKVTKRNVELDLEKMKNEMKELEIYVDQINTKISMQEPLVKEVRRSDKIAGLMRELNERIRTYEFKSDVIWDNCQDVLEQLRSLGLTCTEEWLIKQIERVQRLG